MAENKSNISKRTGDILFITEAENVSTDASGNYFRAIEDGYVESNISDSVRLICGSFWCVTETSGQKLYNKKYQNSPVKDISQTVASFSPDGSVQEHIRLTFATDYHAHTWSYALDDMVQREEPNFDHTTSLHAFEHGSNLQEESAGVANHYAQIKTDYNFLERKYEEVIEATNAPEPILPCFYNFLLKDQSATLRSKLSLRDRINIPPSQRIDGEQETFKPVSNYYKQWAKNFGDYRLDNSYEFDLEDMELVTFTKEEMVLLSDLYKHKESFPMFATAEFTTANDSVLGDTLEKTSFSSKLNEYTHRDQRYKDVVEVLTTKSNSGETSGVQIIPGSKKFSDVKEFFEKYTPGTTESAEFFFNENIKPEARYQAYYNLMSVIAQGKMDRLAKDYTRTYKEILEGKKAHTETIAYTLSKYDEAGNYVQSYRFPNTSKVDVIRFVDSQVRYDKRYTYKIKCQNIVFGTEYNITTINTYGDVPNQAFMVVESKPSIKLVEFDLFEKSVLVSDNPPIAPEITPIPFRNINNKIKILMNTGIGRYSMKPIMLSPDEADKIEKYKVAQDVPSLVEKIKFETDDAITKFCVYRTDKKPTSYMDFVDYGEEIVIKTNGASSASLEDTIEPNKKYYYFARSEDYHGNKSFPSVVYEVIMMDDSGSVYPIIRTYDFEKPVTKQPTVGVKRFLNVKPSRENLFVNKEDMGVFDSDRGGPIPGDIVALGINSDSVWFKKFKIRLTSKSTGRKIDFNFKMNYKTKETTEEES